MQTMGVTGKLYNVKYQQGQNGKGRVTFRVGVRKEFVSDADKQANKTGVFLPCIAHGPTADFINQWFKNGDVIAIKDMEYQTYRSQNADPNNTFDDAHIFKVNKVGFVPGANDQNGGGNGNQAQSNQRQGNNNGGQRNNNGGGYGGGNGGGYGGNNNANQGQPAGGGYMPDDDLPF